MDIEKLPINRFGVTTAGILDEITRQIDRLDRYGVRDVTFGRVLGLAIGRWINCDVARGLVAELPADALAHLRGACK